MQEETMAIVASPAENRVQAAVASFAEMAEFVRRVLRQDIDYGVIPGTDKRTLLKPGAEKLLRFFNVSVTSEIADRVEDWTGANHGGEPFFYYLFKFIGVSPGGIVVEAFGSCNSWETKFRYRQQDRVCPRCGRATIKKSKYPPRDYPDEPAGWYCYTKIGGCGAEFSYGDKSIIEQQVGRGPNPDVADVVNTVLKQAHKRGYVALCLLATCASEYFTQDLEDLSEGAVPMGERAEVAPAAPQTGVYMMPAIAARTVQEPQPAGHMPVEPAAVVEAAPVAKPAPAAPSPAPSASPAPVAKKVFTKPAGPRPLDPASLRKFLHENRGRSTTLAGAKQLQLMVSLLKQVLGKDETAPYLCVEWLWGLGSNDVPTVSQAGTTIDWLLEGQPKGSYAVNETAKEELLRVYRKAQEEAGQVQMDLPREH